MDNLIYFDFIPLELLEIITFYINNYDGLLWINSKYPKILDNKYFWLNKVKESFGTLYNVLAILSSWDINRIIVEKILNTSITVKRKIELYSGLYKVYDSIEKKLANTESYEYYRIKITLNIDDLIPLLPKHTQKKIIESIELLYNEDIINEYGEPTLILDFYPESGNDYERTLIALHLIRKMIGVRGFFQQIKVELDLDDDKTIDLYLEAIGLI